MQGKLRSHSSRFQSQPKESSQAKVVRMPYPMTLEITGSIVFRRAKQSLNSGKRKLNRSAR